MTHTSRPKRTLALCLGIPLLLLLFAHSTWNVVAASRAALGHGRPGTFVAVEEKCNKFCAWRGNFIPADGSSPRRDIKYAGAIPPDTLEGTRFAALDSGALDEVFEADGPWNPGPDLIIVLLGLIVVGSFIRIGLILLRNRQP